MLFARRADAITCVTTEAKAALCPTRSLVRSASLSLLSPSALTHPLVSLIAGGVEPCTHFCAICGAELHAVNHRLDAAGNVHFPAGVFEKCAGKPKIPVVADELKVLPIDAPLPAAHRAARARAGVGVGVVGVRLNPAAPAPARRNRGQLCVIL